MKIAPLLLLVLLICNADPDATSYRVEVDGKTITTPAPLKLTLPDVEYGRHEVKAQACQGDVCGDAATIPVWKIYRGGKQLYFDREPVIEGP